MKLMAEFLLHETWVSLKSQEVPAARDKLLATGHLHNRFGRGRSALVSVLVTGEGAEWRPV